MTSLKPNPIFRLMLRQRVSATRVLGYQGRSKGFSAKSSVVGHKPTPQDWTSQK